MFGYGKNNKLKWNKDNYFKDKNIVVIGFFDGVHKGHENIIRKCALKSLQTGKKSLALTFDKPPQNIITGRKEKKLIISLVPIRVYTIAKKVKKYIKTMS